MRTKLMSIENTDNEFIVKHELLHIGERSEGISAVPANNGREY
ncbi:MAG: hypothetical protein WBZ36_28415 [Candidatus Nitrosopolaris sp.]